VTQKNFPKFDPLRVLVISEHYYPITGGSVTYVHNLCRFLAEFGHSVYLVTPGSDERSYEQWEEENSFSIYRVSVPKYLRKERYFPIFLCRELSSILSEIHPDVVHIAYGFFAPMSMKLLNIKSIPLIWTVHNVPPAEHIFSVFKNGTTNEIFKDIYFKVVSLFSTCCFKFYDYSKIICVSESTEKKVLRKGVSQDKVCIIPNGVSTFTEFDEPHQVGKKEDSLVILTVGGIIEHKGQLEVVKAAPYVLKEYPKAKFVFVGPIRSLIYLEVINSTAESLDIQDHIQITGEVSEKELHKHYTTCDVYIQPSFQEGFCITIMEAMAHGKAVVGTAVGAIPDLIGDDRGILLKNLSEESISQAIISLLSNKDLRDKFSERGKKYIIDTYSWKSVAQDTGQVYQDLLLAGENAKSR